MNFLPIAINIAGKSILIVGGGRIALQKIRSLARYEADVTVLATHFQEELRESGATLIQKSYSSEDVKGFFLVYACTDQSDLNRRVYEDCLVHSILVNVCDCPALCDFVSPAIYKMGNISVAVTSNGLDARKSISCRNKIREFLE